MRDAGLHFARSGLLVVSTAEGAKPPVTRIARIVLLNGVGSAGKSSIAKALQAVAADPFLHVPMDAFLDMLPDAYHDHPEGFLYETPPESGTPLTVIRAGPVAARALRGMRRAIAAMAAEGNDLIVDDVLLGPAWSEYSTLLEPYRVFLVGVRAPLDVLEARERLRGDRAIGLARWQFDLVHDGMTYDLELDTSQASAMDCARRIKQAFGL